MQNFLLTSYHQLQKDNQKLHHFQRLPPSQKPMNILKTFHIPFKSQNKKPQLSARSSLPLNNFIETKEKLKEIQAINQQAIIKKRATLQKTNKIPKKAVFYENLNKKTLAFLKPHFPKETGVPLKISGFLSNPPKKNGEKAENKRIYKEKNIKKALKDENKGFYKEKIMKKLKKTDFNSSNKDNKDHLSTNYTEKEEIPRDLKVRTTEFLEIKEENRDFFQTFPSDLTAFSPFKKKIPMWKACSIDKQFDKLNDLMENTRNARNNLLDIQINLLNHHSPVKNKDFLIYIKVFKEKDGFFSEESEDLEENMNKIEIFLLFIKRHFSFILFLIKIFSYFNRILM